MENKERMTETSSQTEPQSDLSSLRLSVVIPTYNRKASLLLALGALAKQTYPANQFEVIVVSDGSSDGSAEAVRDLKTPYRLRFMEQKNSGPSVARNFGARIACAPVIVYLDDDIEPVSVFLEEHAKAHENDPTLVLIGPQSEPLGEAMPYFIAWEHAMLRKQYENFESGVWKAGPNNLYSGNFSVRREHLISVGGFNEKFTRQEDVELGFRLAQIGLHFRYEGKANGFHRPTRTFQSWCKTPFEYGKRDVQMARDGGEEKALEMAQEHFGQRNRITRFLAKTCIGVPPLEAAVMTVCKVGAQSLPRKFALGFCSLLFNLRYLQGMSQELGGRQKLWNVMKSS